MPSAAPFTESVPEPEPTPVAELAARAKAASRAMAAASTAVKDAALHAAADLLVTRADQICAANAIDVERAIAGGTPAPLVDRLRLSIDRIDAMAGGLRQIAARPDPVGEVADGWVRPNGLRIERLRVPLGVVAIIYESRPNVTSDAAGLCLKSGNAAFLRGSSSAIQSNLAIAAAIREAIASAGLPADGLVLVEDTSRAAAVEFMQQNDYVDCLIPRGGTSLLESVIEHATVPVVIDGAGNCHAYVDASADLDAALNIVVNGKIQRPGVCNALESLVVHSAVAAEFLPRAADALAGVELVGDKRARQAVPSMGEATAADHATEFLDLKMSVRVVDTLDEAIAHVNDNGSGHSETIITSDLAAADRFTKQVDAAAVLVNASTRFVDGEEFGFGAEIGISTQKLHARGPMGLDQLTTLKFVVRGEGHVR
ncbi:MAG: glutamate-5-semialdehyde dehydrogenase [Acidimicrobiaceae bacterium]|nr:glutamate-5-semialdehyde dehydrogenase [Acidimicrobiaceae bacterium]MYB88325.1 glutamate-5-semialdehyde dehydrogenase [Acidimicrobiaceae bacterium]MYI34892.1 glutamate-5-semialdehyde dehydrogenase [Acidimicrobiaceae bacterium]